MSTAEQQSPQTQQQPGERGRSTTDGLTAEQIEKLQGRMPLPARSDGGAGRMVERDRLATGGRRTDNGSFCTLLFVHEADGSWTIHLGDAPAVRVSAVDMTALATAILVRAR